MCPEAHARIARPKSATAPPIASVKGRGFASSKNTPATKKPSGTRQRCTQVPPLRATCDHLDCFGKRTRTPQPLADGLDNTLDADVHTNPNRTRATVTIHAAADVVALDADVILAGRAVAPPLG